MNCKQCNKKFKSYNPNPKFCSLECKYESQKTPLDNKEVKRLYAKGFSQKEIAEKLKTTQKVIYKRMKILNIKARKAAPRNQKKENNNNWKGENITYAAAHKRVEIERGKPKVCSSCKTTKAKKYEWANISGDYLDTQDYIRLCVSCHRLFDSKRRKETGEKTMKTFNKKGGCQ